MNIRPIVKVAGLLLLAFSCEARGQVSKNEDGAVIASISPGPFDASVASLQQYQCPDWFRDAKFGIWAHWGPQSVGEDGDQYSAQMYWYTRHPEGQEDWQRRIRDVVETYHPDLLYSDGGISFGALGRAMVADFYNTNLAANKGRLTAVYTCKATLGGEFYPGTGVLDVERGNRQGIEPTPWQSDTSNGDWFYDKHDHYKTVGTMLRLLADIISKNGNMLLNVVLKPDGSLPSESKELLDGLAAWMKVNSEAIFATRPRKVYGEGPTAVASGNGKEDYAFTAADIRFTTKDGMLYAICLGVPNELFTIHSLSKEAANASSPVRQVSLLGSTSATTWRQDALGLTIQPAANWPCKDVVVYKIAFQ